MRRLPRGFTLIELMIGIVILAVLMMLATPTMQTMRGNGRIRNTAESIANGIRLAQVEAIRRNRSVEFRVIPGTGWQVFDPAAGFGLVQQEPFGVVGLVVDVNPPAATMLTFSGLGAYTDPNPSDGTAPITFVDVSSPSTPGQKELRVVVGPQFLTGSRVCDPDFTIVQQPAFGCP